LIHECPRTSVLRHRPDPGLAARQVLESGPAQTARAWGASPATARPGDDLSDVRRLNRWRRSGVPGVRREPFSAHSRREAAVKENSPAPSCLPSCRGRHFPAFREIIPLSRNTDDVPGGDSAFGIRNGAADGESAKGRSIERLPTADRQKRCEEFTACARPSQPRRIVCRNHRSNASRSRRAGA